jgi:hypothetical protein
MNVNPVKVNITESKPTITQAPAPESHKAPVPTPARDLNIH